MGESPGWNHPREKDYHCLSSSPHITMRVFLDPWLRPMCFYLLCIACFILALRFSSYSFIVLDPRTFSRDMSDAHVCLSLCEGPNKQGIVGWCGVKRHFNIAEQWTLPKPVCDEDDITDLVITNGCAPASATDAVEMACSCAVRCGKMAPLVQQLLLTKSIYSDRASCGSASSTQRQSYTSWDLCYIIELVERHRR